MHGLGLFSVPRPKMPAWQRDSEACMYEVDEFAKDACDCHWRCHSDRAAVHRSFGRASPQFEKNLVSIQETNDGNKCRNKQAPTEQHLGKRGRAAADEH